MKLEERIQLLRDVGQISEDTAAATFKLLQRMAEKWQVVLTEENGAMLITHFALAWERIGKDACVEPLDAGLAAEVQADAHYPLGRRILDDWDEVLGVKIPESEKLYLAVHMCTLLTKEGKV